MAHIEKRVRNGRRTYRARYRDPTGRERVKTFDRKLDAENFPVAIEHAKRKGAYVDPQLGKISFGDMAERWYATKVALRASTRRDYRALLDRQILPAFAAVRLLDLDRLAVEEWLAGLVGGGLSAKRAGKAHQVLAQVLGAAVNGGRLATNVAVGSSSRRSNGGKRCS